MSTDAYFVGYHYQPNPNIIIVPTVSFCPPSSHTDTEQIADRTSTPTSPTLHCEHITPVKDNIGEPSESPCRSNGNQQNMQAISSNRSTSTEMADNFKNSLCVIQDKISTETPAFNRSQNIQDPCTSKYKSSHNLVDLTGFNLPKRKIRSTSSLPKHKDLIQIDDTKIEQDKMKTSYDETEHRDFSESDSYKTNNIAKEPSTSKKPTSEKPTSTLSERNTENLACEFKENKTDKDDKKYFKQLSKRSFEKLKDKAAKEKHGKVIKNSIRRKQEYKDSKEESTRSKTNLQKDSNSNCTKDLRNKIIESSRDKTNLQKASTRNSIKDLRNKIIESSRGKANLQNVSNCTSAKYLRNKIIDSSKKYHDLDRTFMDKFTKRSKSETNSGYLPDSQVSRREQKIDLRPDSIKRYNDFQRFIRHNDDHEVKYKSGDQIKTENLPRNKIQMKSCETKTNKPVIKKKVDESKKSIKTEKSDKVYTNQTNLERVENYTDMERAIDQNNKDRVKIIKSVVRVNKNVHNNLSQSKRVKSGTSTGVQDLRLRLSRKRTKSENFGHYHEPMENKLDQESLTISIKQDVKADSMKSPILAPTVNKPKPKKCKRIKLIINIEFPNSDSDNSDQNLNECCSSPEDLSFLDDLNIDEIVDSLNNSQVEPNKTIDNDYIKKEQTKPKEGLINDVNMKAIKITKKEETSSHKGQVIEINSDTEDDDMNLKMGSVARKKCKNEQNMDKNAKVDTNTKQEANNITDLTEIGYEENRPKETMDLCKDEQFIFKTNSKIKRNTKHEANHETGLNGKDFDENAVMETINLTGEDRVVEVINISDQNGHSTISKHLQQKKTIQNSIVAKKVNLAKYKLQLKPSLHNAQHEDRTDLTAKQKLDATNITDKKQTASLQTIFNIEQNTSVNSNVKSDVIKQLNTLNKKVKGKNENSQTSKNSIEQNDEIKINSEPLNVSDIKENRPQKSISISKKPLETEENIVEKANNKMNIIPLCRSSKNVKEHLQIFENTANKPKDNPIIEKKTNNAMSLPQSKNELLFDSGNSTKGTLETVKSSENCLSSPHIDIRPQSSLDQNNKPKGEPLLKSVETTKTSSKANFDNGEQKIKIRSEFNKSDKNKEEKALLTLENSGVKSEKSPERSNIQHKPNVTTSVELTNSDKNIEVTSIANAENSLSANNKETSLTSKTSDVENQTKSETVKNSTQKLETIDDACDLKTITMKSSELGKRSEITTNTETTLKQVVSNKILVPDEGNKNKDEKKSNKQAQIFTPPMQPFLSKLESRMSEYLQKKYIFSVIHKGRFSTIYKCCVTKGETYAVKVVTQRKIGMIMKRMSFLLQQYRPRQDSFVLYLRRAFEVENRWCLLTEYYPKNLIQALREYSHGFHIDQVQVLSRQLVDAVNMLSYADIIHSDIKPTHILLNSAHTKLKLCGFDRSNYSTSLHITPSTGTPSYRAPEVILGFQEDHRIDIWSTALVMFEMATNKTLFVGGNNNVILYQQLCTIGTLDCSMLKQSKFAGFYFSGTSFLRKVRYKNYEETFVVHSLPRNDYFRRTLFQSYEKYWAHGRSRCQMWKDMNKLEMLHTLLEQMLVLDPRNRLPIQFVGANDFMIHQFRMT